MFEGEWKGITVSVRLNESKSKLVWKWKFIMRKNDGCSHQNALKRQIQTRFNDTEYRFIIKLVGLYIDCCKNCWEKVFFFSPTMQTQWYIVGEHTAEAIGREKMKLNMVGSVRMENKLNENQIKCFLGGYV